jgi:tetratricopeptide (TPR) repeat protein
MTYPSSDFDFRQALDLAVKSASQPYSWAWLVPAAFFPTLAAFYGMSAPMFFIVLGVQLILLWHALSLLGRFASGEADPRQEMVEETATIDAFVTLVGTWIALYSFRFAGESLGATAGAIVALVISFAKPAVIMSIGMQNRMMPSLDPQRWLLIMTSLRSKYLAIWLCMVLYTLLSSQFERWFFGKPLGFFVVFAAELFIFWLLLVGFCLCGWCMHAHRLELGYLSHSERSEQVRTAMHMSAKNRPTAASMIEQGRTKEALIELYERARAEPHQVLKQQEYFDALMLYGTPDKQAVQAAQLLRAYVRAERALDTVKLLDDWYTQIASDIAHPDYALRVADLAASAKRLDLARKILERFEADNLGLIALPDVILAHSKLLAAGGLREEALALAQKLAARYHTHEAAKSAQTLILELSKP